MTIGKRLKEARIAARYGSQGALADAIGIKRESQNRFESGRQTPGGEYLIAVASLGLDVNYVLTGRPGAANDVEGALLQRFRESSSDVQGVVLRALEIPATGQKASSVAITGGEQGQVVAGNVSQREVTFNVGGKKRGARK